jgi:hypothetical protein
MRDFRDPMLLAPVAVIAASALLLVVNPATGVYPPCPSQLLFGVDCPLCGGLRATSSLLQGDIGSFIDHNALLLVLYPLLAVYWVIVVIQKLNPKFTVALPPSAKGWLIFGVIVLVGGFTVLRNMFPFLGSGIS